MHGKMETPARDTNSKKERNQAPLQGRTKKKIQDLTKKIRK